MKKRILVIDDEMDIADLIKLVLETEAFTVKTVIDPLSALDEAREYKPDAILLDLLMPKMNGWEIFNLIKKDKELASIPVAILTARSQEFDALVGLHVMNANAYITKPFGKQELINKVNELFKKD